MSKWITWIGFSYCKRCNNNSGNNSRTTIFTNETNEMEHGTFGVGTIIVIKEKKTCLRYGRNWIALWMYPRKNGVMSIKISDDLHQTCIENLHSMEDSSSSLRDQERINLSGSTRRVIIIQALQQIIVIIYSYIYMYYTKT